MAWFTTVPKKVPKSNQVGQAHLKAMPISKFWCSEIGAKVEVGSRYALKIREK